jgi:hypothetical protein
LGALLRGGFGIAEHDADLLRSWLMNTTAQLERLMAPAGLRARGS